MTTVTVPIERAAAAVLAVPTDLRMLPRLRTESIHMGTLEPYAPSEIPEVWKEDGDEAIDSNGISFFPDAITDDSRTRSFACACAVGGTLSAGSAIRIDFLTSRAKDERDFTPLDPAVHGKPAGYGDLRAGVTKFDSTVRSARALASTEVIVHVNDVKGTGGPVFNALADHVQNTLFRDDDRAVTFVLDKVNMYGPGDHFAKHVDTPRNKVAGTLVITCPRSQYMWEGEGLILHGCGPDLDPVHTTDTMDTTDTMKTTTSLFAIEHHGVDEPTWTAFYSDVVHEVRPVLSGHRVSLSYSIILSGKRKPKEDEDVDDDDDDDDGKPGRGSSAVDEEHGGKRERERARAVGLPLVTQLGMLPCSVSVKWVRAVRDKVLALPWRSKVAILCTNRYSFDEIEAGVLKGLDIALAKVEAMTWMKGGGGRAQGRVVVRPVCLRLNVEHYESGECSQGRPPVTHIQMYRMTRTDIVRAVSHAHLFDKDIELVGKTTYTLIIPHACLLNRVSMDLQQGSEHTGNEARPFTMDARYWTACMFFEDNEGGGDDATTPCVVGGVRPEHVTLKADTFPASSRP